MTESTSSAEPEQLYRYAAYALDLDNTLQSEGRHLTKTLRHFERRCKEPGVVDVSVLGENLRAYGELNKLPDERVREVGKGFARADGQSLETSKGGWLSDTWANISSLATSAGSLCVTGFTWLINSPSWLINKVKGGRIGVSLPESSGPLLAKGQPVETGHVEIPRPIETGPLGFIITSSPVPMDKVTWFNWYGNTETAYRKRDELYSKLQGLHSGLDFGVPDGTPITNTIDRPGVIASIDGSPYYYGAGPYSILVDYGDFLILYGHTSDTEKLDPEVKVGDTVNPGDLIGYTGTDNRYPHLHMEVIKKNPEWDSLPDEQKKKKRPGDIRTNPAPYLSPKLREQVEAEARDKFHPTDDGRWQTPDDQPDIVPGGPYLI